MIQSYILAVLYIYRLSRLSLIGIRIYRQECGTYIQRYSTLISPLQVESWGLILPHVPILTSIPTIDL